MGTQATRSVADLAEWTTLGLLALSVSVAPIALLGALVFDRMG